MDDKGFWSRIDKSGSCWLWQGGLSEGYGQLRFNGKRVRAHRYSYEQAWGLIPEGLELDHLCRVLNCVDPLHLEVVTGVENTMRGLSPPAINARKTECKYGHVFNDANTEIRPSDGYRQCRTCRRDESRLRKRRMRALAAALVTEMETRV